MWAVGDNVQFGPEDLILTIDRRRCDDVMLSEVTICHATFRFSASTSLWREILVTDFAYCLLSGCCSLCMAFDNDISYLPFNRN